MTSLDTCGVERPDPELAWTFPVESIGGLVHFGFGHGDASISRGILRIIVTGYG